MENPPKKSIIIPPLFIGQTFNTLDVRDDSEAGEEGIRLRIAEWCKDNADTLLNTFGDQPE